MRNILIARAYLNDPLIDLL